MRAFVATSLVRVKKREAGAASQHSTGRAAAHTNVAAAVLPFHIAQLVVRERDINGHVASRPSFLAGCGVSPLVLKGQLPDVLKATIYVC